MFFCMVGGLDLISETKLLESASVSLSLSFLVCICLRFINFFVAQLS